MTINVPKFFLYHHQHIQWGLFNKFEATVFEALEKLNDLIDESDPDVTIPNIVHAYQTAERLREAYPNDDWLHLTGLIHDLGKVSGKGRRDINHPVDQLILSF